MSDLDELFAGMNCFDCGGSLLREMQPFLKKTTFPIWEGSGNAVCADCMRARIKTLRKHFELKDKEDEDEFTGDW